MDMVLAFVSVFAGGVWIGVMAPLLWQEWTDQRRRSRVLRSQDPDSATEQHPEG